MNQLQNPYTYKWLVQYRNTGCNKIRTTFFEMPRDFGKRDVQRIFVNHPTSNKFQSLKHLGMPNHVGWYRIRDFVNCWKK